MQEQTSPSQEPLIEAFGVSVQRMYSPGTYIEQVDWKVGPGEYWVVEGGHGSGKSAFLATMAGLRPPGAGLLRHFGHELSRLSEAETTAQRLRVGFVFKNGGRMFAGMTVAENVALPLRYHRDWTEEQAMTAVHDLLETIELTPLAARNAQSLATGWQERVGLARALVLEPEVLFLDEPMAGLEAGQCRWWRGFLDQLSRGAPCMRGRKTTIIAATSDLSLWSGESRHFAVLKDRSWQVLGLRASPPEMNKPPTS